MSALLTPIEYVLMHVDSVSEELLCAFELLKPLDGPALRKEMTKAKRKRCVIFAVYSTDSLTTNTILLFSMMATTT